MSEGGTNGQCFLQAQSARSQRSRQVTHIGSCRQRKEWRKETRDAGYRRSCPGEKIPLVSEMNMAFFNSAVGVLQTLVIALGAGLGIWGVINLMEGYGNDNPGAKSQGMKQLMAGGGVALIGTTLVPLLTGLFG